MKASKIKKKKKKEKTKYKPMFKNNVVNLEIKDQKKYKEIKSRTTWKYQNSFLPISWIKEEIKTAKT